MRVYLQQLVLTLLLLVSAVSFGSEESIAVDVPNRVTAPSAPAWQTKAEAETKSQGCVSCHAASDEKTMHANPAVTLGCVDCHGGDASVMRPDNINDIHAESYQSALRSAHVLPNYPSDWHFPHSANPKNSYTLLNREAPEYVRFVNPSDYRIVREACGACHLPQILAAERSIMATGAMLWGGASYNNGILPYKRYILGEGYTREGEPAAIIPLQMPNKKMAAHGVLPALQPVPAWETVKPGDIFRVFEDGGRNINSLFPEIGIPGSLGQIQRLEEPGRPDLKQSNRGPGTGGRISVPVINLTKTRLNDPLMWFLGTNDQPGDYRSSGCAACHVVYANDREPKHSGPYAQYGHWGKSVTVDPTISKKESGHPLRHTFTRAIPTSQCMVCHMHQPNMFMNTYLGYTMWDYEADAPHMWPEEQKYPTAEEIREVNERNPEGAAPRGKWASLDFLSNVWELNPKLSDTQFADYHGHGWNFRAVFKRDREGNLLDAEGNQVSPDDPKKFSKAVHMASIHADKGMHCVDCHFSQDSHGSGHIYGQVADAIEINCQDCHGTADAYPTLTATGPAAPPKARNLALLRNPDGRKRFEWVNGKLMQRSLVNPGMEWEVSLVKDSVDPNNPHYNAKSARAKLMGRDTDEFHFGLDVKPEQRAHKDDEIECYTCHTSWTTACGGCHLPIEANWKTERHHYEGGKSRNFATYNPQVARDEMFMLGKRGPSHEAKIAPTRSTSALVLSSTNGNRERIYIQQPPIASSGFSSQAFNPHFPHTTRKTETKTCSDCHLSEQNDNNAIMAQLLMLGTNYINFVGRFAWVGEEGGISAVGVTEWDEPQSVYGSYLHKYAYPDYYQQHIDRDRELETVHTHRSGNARCLQTRGEYLYVAEGEKGFRVYDIASIDNKGFSQRIVSAPFSKLGQDNHIDMPNASCVVLPTNQPIAPLRNTGALMRKVNLEQPFHPIFNYALITDEQDGLVLVDVNTFADGEFRNNNIERAVTWNPDSVLNGARHISLAGHFAYIATPSALVVVDLDTPLRPKLVKTITMDDVRSSAVQFRYLLVAHAGGVETLDITRHADPKVVQGSLIKLDNPQRIYLARAFAYVAAGRQGLAIIDIVNPEKPSLYQLYDADGKMNDARDVIVASTNASAFAYVADGENGLKVLQLTSPDSQPNFYGFNPAPKPELVAWAKTPKPAQALSKGLDRDRAVDETGGQIAVFGRLGSRPFTLEEMQKLFLNDNGEPWFVSDQTPKGRAKQ
ncbi:MAG: hypothetical protein P1U67_03285 [Alcanivoracaceae bacterium]|nr:hypothetical protein [Alcanivoracaceae bacterium]